MLFKNVLLLPCIKTCWCGVDISSRIRRRQYSDVGNQAVVLKPADDGRLMKMAFADCHHFHSRIDVSLGEMHQVAIVSINQSCS